MADTQISPRTSVGNPSTASSTQHSDQRPPFPSRFSSFHKNGREPHTPSLDTEASSSTSPSVLYSESTGSSTSTSQQPPLLSHSFSRSVSRRLHPSVSKKHHNPFRDSQVESRVPKKNLEKAPWRQKKLTSRIGWALEQTFSGLSLEKVQVVSAQKGEPKEVNIQHPDRSRRLPTDSPAAQVDHQESQSDLHKGAPDQHSSSYSSQEQSSSDCANSYHTCEPEIAGNEESLNSITESGIQFEDFAAGNPIALTSTFLENDSLAQKQRHQQQEDMGLGRAFTKRLGREEPQKHLKISLPVEFISTTNQWVQDAPTVTEARENFTHKSSLDSNNWTPSSGPPTLTDSSSVESYSPTEPSPFFSQVSATGSGHVQKTSESSIVEPPKIPSRAASHSKKEHLRLARARSVRSSISGPSRPGSSHTSPHLGEVSESTLEEPSSDNTVPKGSPIRNTVRDTLDMLGNGHAPIHPAPPPMSSTPAVIEEHPTSQPSNQVTRPSTPPQQISQTSQQKPSPFTSELANLSTFAADLRAAAEKEEDEEDVRVMKSLGLKCWTVNDYIADIEPLSLGLWDVDEEDDTVAWV